MIVEAKINYLKALRVTGLKFLYLFLFTFLLSYLIQLAHWEDKVIPEKFLALIVSAMGIFLGFRINAAYTRWRDGQFLFRDLTTISLSFMSQLTLLLKYRPMYDEEFFDFKRKIAVCLLQHLYLIEIELRNAEPIDWHAVLKKMRFNNEVLFSEQLIVKLLTKKRKATYMLSVLTELIRKQNVKGTINHYNMGELSLSIQKIYLHERALTSLKYTPFPWGYRFYTRVFVWLLPILLACSSLNDFNIVHILVISSIGIIFVTTEQIARNLDDPITNEFNSIPFLATIKLFEIGLLEFLDIPHPLDFDKAKDGVLR